MTLVAWILLGLGIGAGWALFQRGRAQRDTPPESAAAAPPASPPSPPSSKPDRAPGLIQAQGLHDAAPGTESAKTPETPQGADAPGWPVLPGLSVDGLLGRGASATVYSARDLASGDAVAVKLFHTALDGQGQARLEDNGDLPRFLQEVQTLERLQHPGIVRARRSGQVQGRVHLVMDLLQGQSLRAWCGSQRLPGATVARVARQILDALAHAHEQGIVHRDLKPDNILFDEASGRVTLTDFGVARWLQDSQTRSGMMLGSPAYMAPEQLMGLPSDARTDLYALGVVLTELLSGRPAFDAPSLGALMQAILQSPVPALTGPAAAWNPFIARLCARDAAQRPANAREALTLLDTVAA